MGEYWADQLADSSDARWAESWAVCSVEKSAFLSADGRVRWSAEQSVAHWAERWAAD
jgi:hypothetical protein